MNLLVGLFLVLVNSFNSATAKIPTTEGINALVAYLFTCIFFVFCAMLGYAGKSRFLLIIDKPRSEFQIPLNQNRNGKIRTKAVTIHLMEHHQYPCIPKYCLTCLQESCSPETGEPGALVTRA